MTVEERDRLISKFLDHAWDYGATAFVERSIQAAKENGRRQNIVVDRDGVHLLFDMPWKGKWTTGELACYTWEELKEPDGWGPCWMMIGDLYVHTDYIELQEKILWAAEHADGSVGKTVFTPLDELQAKEDAQTADAEIER